MKKREMYIIAAGLLLAAAVSAIVFTRPDAPTPQLRIQPVGDPVLTAPCGQEYVDPGAEGTYTLSDETGPVEVQTTGHVDTATLGSYYVKYIVQMEDTVATAYRRVDVVDTVAPQITLVSNPDRVPYLGEIYQEEGFTATDNYDGDITHLVHREQTSEKVIYTVSDSSGNTTSVERWIAYLDTTPPALTLAGGDYYCVPAGVAYQEPGWSAIDNRDGDLSGAVAMSGWVDIRNPGDYVLSYTVTDSSLNTTTVYRTVHVYPQTAPEVVIPEGNVIYLTFDDGPGPYTEQLLDLLKRYNVKATFFVVNNSFSHLIKRIVEEGHAIGIHANNHNFRQVYANDEAFLNDLYTMQGVIRDISGVETTLMRFPGGSSNTASKKYSRGIMTRLTQKVVQLGFQYFDWNVDSNDAGGSTTSHSVYTNVVEGIGNKSASIVLQHDIKDYSVGAVEWILDWGINNGYAFLPLTNNSPGFHHPINN